MRWLLALTLPALGLTALFFRQQPTAEAVVQTPQPAHPPKKETEARKTPGIGYAKQVAPLLAKYCVSCHKGDKPRAGFSLDRITDDVQAADARKTWEKVMSALQAREMPPANKPQPTSAERDLLLNYLGEQLTVVDCSKGRDPGRVTIRRLNRTEYNNTIRDLVGVNFQPADDFPADDIGYGFDNIGDVLSMSPILLEKYLGAAERIVGQAILVGKPTPPVTQYARRELLADATIPPAGRGGFRAINNNGEVYAKHTFTRDADHTFKVRAYAQQAGKESAKMALKLDDKTLTVFDVKAEEANPKTYEFTAKVQAGERRITAAFINDFYDPKATDPKQRDRNLLVQFIEVHAPAGDAYPETHRRIMIVQPSEKVNKDEAARQIIENFARKAFRRPVAKAEVEKYLPLVKLAEKQGDSFEQGIGLAVQAILVSPHFLFRIEHDQRPNDPTFIHNITEFELATRLAYFLWSSMPDETLFSLAQKGELRKNLKAQVSRMLEDPKSQALVENFAGQWLQYRNLKTLSPDAKLFPEFDEKLRNAMAKEPELFFEAIMRENRSITDFLEADFTFLNDRLARHYQIPGVSGSQFRRVTLKDDRRGGVLTMASVLTVTSNPTRTSPVKRGKWILENILNAPTPPPPPDAGELSDEKEVVLSGSLRKRMEMHRVKTECASCHSKMDPLGFGFENFDAVGAWRTKDGNFDVDSSGTLPTGETFKGPKELKVVLKKREEAFGKCLTEKLLTYALGRGLEYYDRCAVEDIVRALSKDQYKFSTLVYEIVKSDPFQKRRGKKGEHRE